MSLVFDHGRRDECIIIIISLYYFDIHWPRLVRRSCYHLAPDVVYNYPLISQKAVYQVPGNFGYDIYDIVIIYVFIYVFKKLVFDSTEVTPFGKIFTWV